MNSNAVLLAFNKYSDFIKNNPIFVSEVEVALRWISYFAAGRFTQSAVISELFHSSSNLLTLLNDTILRKAADIPIHIDASIERLQISLSVIEYVEVFIEVAARKLGGSRTRWLMIVIIQGIKCVIRLLLVLKNKKGIQKSPAISPLNRRTDVPQFCQSKNGTENCVSDPCSSGVAVTFTLKRSGRVIRSLEAAPPLSGRTWRLPVTKNSIMHTQMLNGSSVELSRVELTAEVLHIIRPLVHLSAMGAFGKKSWKPWLIALGIDVSSLHYLKGRKQLGYVEGLEWSRRALNLIAYLLRSPFYDRFSKFQILCILESLAENVRGAGVILRPVIEYIPEWQRTYFYAWSI